MSCRNNIICRLAYLQDTLDTLSIISFIHFKEKNLFLTANYVTPDSVYILSFILFQCLPHQQESSKFVTLNRPKKIVENNFQKIRNLLHFLFKFDLRTIIIRNDLKIINTSSLSCCTNVHGVRKEKIDNILILVFSMHQFEDKNTKLHLKIFYFIILK